MHNIHRACSAIFKTSLLLACDFVKTVANTCVIFCPLDFQPFSTTSVGAAFCKVRVWMGLGWTVRQSGTVQVAMLCYGNVIYIYIIVLVYVHRDSIRESVLAQDLFMTRQERQDALRRSLPMLGMQLEQFFVLAHLLSFFLYYLVFFQKWSQRS